MKTGIGLDIHIFPRDREILRELAKEVRELSGRPVEAEKKALWYSHNDLENTRPLIFCDPENGWREIITEDILSCSGKTAREWEFALRKEIFWGRHMGDDRVIEPYFNIGYHAENTGWGIQSKQIGGENGGAYKWEAPLKDYTEMFKLRHPAIVIDEAETRRCMEAAGDIFDDILTVRLKHSWWWSLGMTLTLANLRGLEQMMYDMYDFPDELHALMAFIRDGQLKMLEYLGENNLLSLNNDGAYVGSGGFGWTRQLPSGDHVPGKVRTADMWGFAESQETSQISPEMFREFIFPYQLAILEKFGINCYGCCEPLNKRWDTVRQIPRLRRVSVSPWADAADMAEKMEDRYIYSWKPNPAYLAVSSMDEEYIRRNIRGTLKVTKKCNVEMIMKDNNTLANQPQNAVKWCRIAREEAENAMGA